MKTIFFKDFKNNAGYSFLSAQTLIVGLENFDFKTISKSNVKSDSHYKWNPRLVDVTIEQSRRYLLRTSLAWIFDNIESYISEVISLGHLSASANLNLGHNSR